MTIKNSLIVKSAYAILFFLTPLLMFSKSSEIFEFNKLLLIYLVSGFVLSYWILRTILHNTIILRKSLILLPLMLFLLSQIVSTYYSIDIQTSIFGYYGRFNGGLLSIIAYMVLSLGLLTFLPNSLTSRRKFIDSLLKVSIISSIIVMLWGIPSKFGFDLTCYIFTGQLNTACWTEQFDPTARIFSTIGQPNWLGAYATIHFFIGLGYLLKEKVKLHSYGYMLYLILTFVTILFTGSRSALLGVVGGLLIFGIHIFVTRKKSLTKELIKTYSIVGAIILSSIILFGTGVTQIDSYVHLKTLLEKNTVVNEEVQNRVESQSGGTALTEITGSGEIRKIVWQGAYNVGMANLWFGTGPETFAYSYNFFRPIEHNTTSEWNFVYNKAHNEFLNYFATTGIFGLLTYVFYILTVVIIWLRVYKSENDENVQWVVTGLFAAFISIQISNFFGFSTTTVQLFFYLIPVFILGYAFELDSSNIPSKFEVSEKNFIKLFIPAALMIFFFAYVLQYHLADKAYSLGDNLRNIQEYETSLPRLYQAYSLRKEHVYEEKISQVLMQMAYLQVAQNQNADSAQVLCPNSDGTAGSCLDLSRQFMDSAIGKSPYNPYYYRTASRNEFTRYQLTRNDADFTRAFELNRQAQELAPTDPRHAYMSGLLLLGKVELQDKPTEDDIKALKSAGISVLTFATDLKPDYYDAWYLKGLVYRQIGDTENAKSTFEYILKNLNPDDVQAKNELNDIIGL